MEQFYKIAGLVVKMDTFGRTVRQAEAYRCEPAQPDITVVTKWELMKEHYPNLSDEDCEYLCTGSSFYRQLLDFEGMMLHSSAVVMDGRAYLFSAPSGTGKSTHTQLWRKVFGDRAVILNDDKPALRFEDGLWYAYGTPWSGKTDWNIDMKAPLAGIAMLERGETNEIERFSGQEAIFAVLAQTVRPRDVGLRNKLLTHLDKLMKTVPVWKLKCNMNKDAPLVSYEAMSAGATHLQEEVK